MRTITLTAENEQDYELVLKLAQRLGLEYREETLAAPAAESAAPYSLPDLSHLSREELLAVIDEGGDGKSFPAPLTEAERQHHLRILAQGGSGKSIPDPLAWQREIRADRPLPGRD
ncbi:hypothetical protein Q5H93_17110 [Hymenobacter sp. ASUV-10]|uniref:Uncharacterized protein n=1 Tax=Hymenobacter aranciens TaxID=3063996 RepID=A0ABT9BE24_9BACT|nr:hypothetical protein [Hymenobacter sp. ASUV-10]MDO7876467.1 hypothetical protein [Hymenobacter sp. ASUV-10]